MKTISIKTKIDFPEFGARNVSAKVDTGAYSGCFHASGMKIRKTDGADQLEFYPFGLPEKTYQTAHFIQKKVKSSNGHIEERYFIDTDVVINGQMYPIRLSLTNRSNMKYPVLIGRKFLIQHNFLVDVNARKD